ncbi:hypothetical protein D1816_04180 [Aquimarina sp. AD10]|uniref:hypothetical protein n=1 Tax=Aquimarina TaxID=290174 RepID=UPI000837A2C5|nr:MULTISPECIES: hypothetical protein [Aquimarina]AXT59584.1 hypothetical protein D1816_04180 [Aquimarina sp. AD10]
MKTFSTPSLSLSVSIIVLFLTNSNNDTKISRKADITNSVRDLKSPILINKSELDISKNFET